MDFPAELYLSQIQRWPTSGRHVLAQYDRTSILVYQAFKPSIAQYAVENQKFGGPDFSLTRMTWIKTNFTWMMYRSGWATKKNQERILAIRLSRYSFEEILNKAVTTSFGQSRFFGTRLDWQMAGETTNVRLQWDPDHELNGNNLQRKAIQLGIRGDLAKLYATEWILSIKDITDFVQEQYQLVQSGDINLVKTPVEDLYPVPDQLKPRLGLGIDEEEH
ncbi:hypothetical protein G9A89_017699 [Geosiphon pyriformis]|nr:hypothetical protein G9A89_017699 [Geosiphon pyriformis]